MISTAAAVLFLHNHPSGNLKPSSADRNLTKQLAEASALLDVKLIDHLVVTKSGFYSFADEGELI